MIDPHQGKYILAHHFSNGVNRLEGANITG